MIRLSVNVNKVATLRNARGGDLPRVREAAEVAIAAGCHGITVHPRPDERHIRFADVEELAGWLPVELNIEGFPAEPWLRLVERVRPAQATLVPDPPDVLTSNAGWRFGEVDRVWLREVVARLHEAGCRVSTRTKTSCVRSSTASGARPRRRRDRAIPRAWHRNSS